MTSRYKLKGQEACGIKVQTEGTRGKIRVCHSFSSHIEGPVTFRYKLKGQEAYDIQVQTEGPRGI